MNLEDFYSEIKGAIDFLGVEWGTKNLISVRIENDTIILSYGYKSVHIKCE